MPETRPPTPPPKKRPRAKPSPEELARDAIAREKIVVGGKVRMTFNVILTRTEAEALAARSIREEKNITAVVAEILRAAVAP
jgi:hypothetical protein